MRCRRNSGATQRDRLYRGCETYLCLPAAGPLVGPAVALGGDVIRSGAVALSALALKGRRACRVAALALILPRPEVHIHRCS